jgi:HrpJ-like domain
MSSDVPSISAVGVKQYSAPYRGHESKLLDTSLPKQEVVDNKTAQDVVESDGNAFTEAFRHSPRFATSPVHQRDITLLGPPSRLKYLHRLMRSSKRGAAWTLLDIDGEHIPSALLQAAGENLENDALIRQLDGIDPFKGYVALLEARELASQDLIVSGRLDALMAALWKDKSAIILAGFNSAPSLLHFAEKASEWDKFRQIYYDSVVSSAPMASVFKSLLAQFGPARLTSAIAALRNAIVADLAAPEVSSNKARMQQQLSDLENNRAMNSLLVEGHILLKSFSKSVPEAQTVVDFLNHVFDFAAGPPHDAKLLDICHCMVGTAVPVTDNVKRVAREFLSTKIPTSLWSSLRERAIALGHEKLQAR